ncbi:phenylacetic acid degradation protein PaaN [Variovorax sp. LjRoot290]|uniref:phenylacetic acid degradation protein PaaN n=1 Tax=Variovorax sp. LjRoot290 TaxID=3342316 RepID=UPI003ECCE2CC
MTTLFDRHRTLLDDALRALTHRGHWSPFPEAPSPKVYGDSAQAEGRNAALALCGKDYPLDQPGERARVATERSPFGATLDIRYPECEGEALVAAALAAEPAWQAIGPEGRVGVVLEALKRIHARSFEIAHAVMLTTGQGPMMAFQAGGPHAQDRALEAIATAWKAMADVPAEATWEKPQGKNPPAVLKKRFEVVGRGIALVIGCATFPTWNTYPGLFAALATGNPVIVKPHPNAVLPAAITVSVLREVLAEEGLDPNLVTLAVSAEPQLAQMLATHHAVASIDYTGGNVFGRWLQTHATQARLYAEMAGVNLLVIESTDAYAAMLRNLALSLSLYSGQMCTTTQNLLVPAEGIRTDQGHKSFEQVGSDLAQAIDQLLADPKVALTVLGAIGSPQTLERLDKAAKVGRTVLASRKLEHPEYPQAEVRTPAIAALGVDDADIYEQECFGPVSYLVAVPSREAALEIAERSVRRHGAMTLGLYSDDPAYIDDMVNAARRARVALSINLTQSVMVNQSAGFSDFHATGGNPSANAAYTTLAFVADRFVVVQHRRHA